MTAVLLVVSLVALGACSRSSSSSTSGGSASGSLGKGDFGTLKAVCGKGPGGNTGSGIGLTPDSITLGTISDPGSAIRPGLNQEIFDASQVFVSWCNSLGGINGRRIEMQKLDAQLFQYKQRILEACRSDFALVGGGGVFDDEGQADRVKCLLPNFPGYLTNPAARAADLTIQQVPTPVQQLNVGILNWIKQQFPGANRVGYLNASVPALINNEAQFKQAAEAIDLKTVYEAQYSATGEATWVPFAQSLKSNKVDGLVYIGEPTDFVKLSRALDVIGYQLKWVFASSNIYDTTTITQGGSSMHNVFLPASTAPFEAAGNGTAQGTAIKQYEELFKQYLPTGKSQATLGVLAFSSWLLFATAAKACGSHIDRKCVFEQAKKITNWTGGGLTVPSNPGSGAASECTGILQATASGFKIRTEGANTDRTIICTPNNVAKVTVAVDVKPSKLSDFGKTEADLP